MMFVWLLATRTQAWCPSRQPVSLMSSRHGVSGQVTRMSVLSRYVWMALDSRRVLLRHVGDDLKLCVGVAGHYAHGDGGVDAPASSCVGDDHGLHILQDVPADLSQDLFRFSAQHLAQFCGTVRDGDGLCTPCGQQELLLQYRRVGGDLRVVQHHTFSFVQLLYSIGPSAG